jgi:hypothetical protein
VFWTFLLFAEERLTYHTGVVNKFHQLYHQLGRQLNLAWLLISRQLPGPAMQLDGRDCLYNSMAKLSHQVGTS